MKRSILLFTMVVFTGVALTSCACIPYNKVKIKTKNAGVNGNKPDVVPRCQELKLGADQQVKWVIDRDDISFIVEFKPDECPFYKCKFSEENPTSGPVREEVAAKVGEKDLVFMYSLKVKGFKELDPAVIIWR